MAAAGLVNQQMLRDLKLEVLIQLPLWKKFGRVVDNCQMDCSHLLQPILQNEKLQFTSIAAVKAFLYYGVYAAYLPVLRRLRSEKTHPSDQRIQKARRRL